ncbi:MAG: hypothetical protein ACJAT1_000434 [Marivirga sp.]|jgi:hypothetical protein
MPYFKLPQLPTELLTHKKVKTAYEKLALLIESIALKPIPDEVQPMIQACLTTIEETSDEKKVLIKALRKETDTILKLLQKHLNLVPKNYYMVLWLSLGLAAFGIPIGIAIGMALGNIAFLGIGFPFGVGIGIAVGIAMDKKAAAEGRQLPVDL